MRPEARLNSAWCKKTWHLDIPCLPVGLTADRLSTHSLTHSLSLLSHSLIHFLSHIPPTLTMSTTTTSKKRKVPAGNQAAAPKKPKAPTSASAPPPPQEKRAARYRSKPPEGVMARIHRAISQRLYLLDQRDTSGGGGTGTSVGTSARPGQQMSRHYAVLGSTGNVYDVDICQKPCCTCPGT
jgi:hypothetical protein